MAGVHHVLHVAVCVHIASLCVLYCLGLCRIGYSMIDSAEKEGKITPGKVSVGGSNKARQGAPIIRAFANCQAWAVGAAGQAVSTPFVHLRSTTRSA
jgi:hypothetical protein